MADEKNMMPELTLTPDTTAAAEEVPALTLEPSAPATPAAPAPEKPAAEPAKLDDSMLSEAEKKAVETEDDPFEDIFKIFNKRD